MTIKEMNARLREIGAEASQLKAEDTERLNALLKEAEDLEAKISAAKNREKLQKLAGEHGEGTDGANGEKGGEGAKDAASKNGKILMSGGTVKRSFNPKNAISSSQTVMTEHTAQDVNPTFNEVSSLVERVRSIPLQGGESYKRGFVKSYGEGDYTSEGGNYKEAEPVFGYASMVKAKITAYCEEPEEITKLAPSAYSTLIGNSTEVAIRKKLSRQILVGTGGAEQLTGIFFNPADAKDDIIDRETDLEISEITETTLDDIIYSYGGEEDVEDAAALILNKLDLKAFAKCRKANGDKAYTIVNRGNTGTIDGIPYIINSACGAISKEDTADGTYCMAYGHLSNYELPIFSDLAVERSKHVKFRQGQIAHRGDIFVGGNVAAYNGFIRVKKGSAAAAASLEEDETDA